MIEYFKQLLYLTWKSFKIIVLYIVRSYIVILHVTYKEQLLQII